MQHLLAGELLSLAVPDLQPPEPPWKITAALQLARDIEPHTSEVPLDPTSIDKVATRTCTAFHTFQVEMGGDFDPNMSEEHGLKLVSVVHQGRPRGVGELQKILAGEVGRHELLEQKRGSSSSGTSWGSWASTCRSASPRRAGWWRP